MRLLSSKRTTMSLRPFVSIRLWNIDKEKVHFKVESKFEKEKKNFSDAKDIIFFKKIKTCRYFLNIVTYFALNLIQFSCCDKFGFPFLFNNKGTFLFSSPCHCVYYFYKEVLTEKKIYENLSYNN